MLYSGVNKVDTKKLYFNNICRTYLANREKILYLQRIFRF